MFVTVTYKTERSTYKKAPADHHGEVGCRRELCVEFVLNLLKKPTRQFFLRSSHFLQSLLIHNPNPCNNTHKTKFNSKMTNASTTVKIVVSMVVAAALVATRMSSSEVRKLEEMVV